MNERMNPDAPRVAESLLRHVTEAYWCHQLHAHAAGYAHASARDDLMRLAAMMGFRLVPMADCDPVDPDAIRRAAMRSVVTLATTMEADHD